MKRGVARSLKQTCKKKGTVCYASWNTAGLTILFHDVRGSLMCTISKYTGKVHLDQEHKCHDQHSNPSLVFSQLLCQDTPESVSLSMINGIIRQRLASVATSSSDCNGSALLESPPSPWCLSIAALLSSPMLLLVHFVTLSIWFSPMLNIWM